MIVNDDSRADDVFEVDPIDSGGMFAHLPWWLIFAVAFVVTELTAHPALGVGVLCLKFGWDDFRTALWLRRRDPNRRRGAVCSWFYLSSGLWRVFLWSFALMLMAIIFLVATEPPLVRGPNRDPAPPPEMITCLCMCLASFAVATMFTVLAVGFAWRCRIKVWISGTISRSRRLNEWPPRPIQGLLNQSNLLKGWLIGTGAGLFVFLFVAGIALILAGVKVMLPRQLGNNQKTAVLVAVIIGVGIPLLTAIFILVVRGHVLRRIEATSPAECWPAGELIPDSDPSD